VDRLRALPAAARMRRGRRGVRSKARRDRGRRGGRRFLGAAHPAAAQGRAAGGSSRPFVAKGVEVKMSRSPLHLTGLLGLERDWVLDLFEHADWLRARRPGATGGKAGPPPRPLAGRTAALVFHKPSLRTRV